MIGEENGKHIRLSPPALTPIHNLPYLQRYIPRLSHRMPKTAGNTEP